MLLSLDDDLIHHVLEHLDVDALCRLAAASWATRTYSSRNEDKPITSADRVEMQVLYKELTSSLRPPDYVATFGKYDTSALDRALRRLACAVGRSKTHVIAALGLKNTDDHGSTYEPIHTLEMEDAVKSGRLIMAVVGRAEDEDKAEIIVVAMAPTKYALVWRNSVIALFKQLPPRIQWLMYRYNLVSTDEDRTPRASLVGSVGFVAVDGVGGVHSDEDFKARIRSFAVQEKEQKDECIVDWLADWEAGRRGWHALVVP